MTNNTITSADLFCGAGGSSTGLAQAAKKLGLPLDLVAVNHWGMAVKTHARNHPWARHVCADLASVEADPNKLVPGGKLDLLVASPECFPAGALILTSNGYVPIEDIVVGTRVLTHRNRWRSVTATMTAVNDTVLVKGQGHLGLETTTCHPFWVRNRKQLHRKTADTYYRYTDPEWKSVSDGFGRKPFWAAPSVIPALPIPPVPGRGFAFTEPFWSFVGLWLAEGCVRIRKASSEITLAVGNHEADRIEGELRRFAPGAGTLRSGMSELRWRRRQVRTATLFETGHNGLALWLVANFGRHSYGKTLPGWVYGMPSAHRRALLSGYLRGDGHVERKNKNPKQTSQTVSRRLAFSVRTLATTLGVRVSIHDGTPGRDVIEGRKVNIRPAYRVNWTPAPIRNWSYQDGQHHWQRVREVAIPGRKGVTVFNLSVDEDESYVVDGVVVHNCTHHSNARGGKPCSDQSRASAWHVLHWMERLRVQDLLLENVREFERWGPLDGNCRPIKERRGDTFQAFLQSIRSLGFNVDYKVLCSADYGAATARRRLFLRASRGKITWPEPSHKGKWRGAREIIDWSLKGVDLRDRKRPLSPRTMNRIEAGLRKFGGEAFITVLRGGASDHGPGVHPLDEPLLTVSAQGTHHGLCEPFILGQMSGNTPRSINDPIPTITTTTRGMALVEPFIMTVAHQGDDNCRCRSLDEPLNGIPAGHRGEHGLVEPFIIPMEHSGRQPVRSTDQPLPTITTAKGGSFGLCQPFLTKYYGTGGAASVDKPLDTITAKGRFALVEPYRMGIRFRMLKPHELAEAMGFHGYTFEGTATDQIKQIGNAVQVDMAEALCTSILQRYVA